MESPLTVILRAGSAFGAGPFATDPSATLNLLPWHGQLIVPLATSPTWQPACVHSAEKHLNVPFVGCVTTTFSFLKILPPPTGMSAVLASGFSAGAPPPPPALSPPALPPVLPVVSPPPVLPAVSPPPVLPPVSALPVSPYAWQPPKTTTTPAAPAPAR